MHWPVRSIQGYGRGEQRDNDTAGPIRSRFGASKVDVDGRRLYRDGREVHVTPKAFDLLLLLVENRHRAMSKTELIERVWPDTFVTEDGLPRLINEIRTAIGDDARRPRWIRTLHGFGYAFADTPDVATDSDATAQFVLRLASREFLLRDGENVIGRDRDAAVPIDGPIVSRRHARIVINEGTAVLEDLGSKNGTFVRDARVSTPVALQDGDQIRVGDFSLVFKSAHIHPTQTQRS
jgi:DNA-binding winged helix-turn-helix (wHTH) protein